MMLPVLMSLALGDHFAPKLHDCDAPEMQSCEACGATHECLYYLPWEGTGKACMAYSHPVIDPRRSLMMYLHSNQPDSEEGHKNYDNWDRFGDQCAAAAPTDAGDEQDCADIAAYGMCGMKINFGSCVGDLEMGSACCAASCGSARNAHVRALRKARSAEDEINFAKFDDNNDGKIDLAELFHVLKGLGQRPTMPELEDMMGEIDESGDGAIDFPEFLDMMAHKNIEAEASHDDEILAAFNFFDENRDGALSTDEYNRPGWVPPVRFQAADTNGDGFVDYAEFAATQQ